MRHRLRPASDQIQLTPSPTANPGLTEPSTTETAADAPTHLILTAARRPPVDRQPLQLNLSE